MASGNNATTTELEDLRNQLDELNESTNGFFLLAFGIIIFLMQGGFAFLEAGSVRTKNTVNILIKNMLDCLLGGLAYWALGWGVAYGSYGNPFVGGSQFFAIGLPPSSYSLWFFQFVFAATTATIVSGAIAERCQLTTYFIYSVVLTGWIYPVVSHWAWHSSDDPDDPSTGWLAQLGYQDFAGSGVVHLLSGCVSLVACYFMGPRTGRFDLAGKPQEIAGHSVPIAAMGGFILMFGFLAFNGGSQGAITTAEDVHKVSQAVIVTVLSACTGGLTVLFFNKFVLKHKWSYLLTLNGTLCGMVSICAGCNVLSFWAAALIGVMGGFMYLAVHFAMLKFKLDDPLDAVAVHGGGGILGVVMAVIFDDGNGLFWKGGTAAFWQQLGVNVLGIVAIVAWSVVWSFLLFFPLKKFGKLRIDEETEDFGIDLEEHGEAAYPAMAYIEFQYGNRLPDLLRADGSTRNSKYNMKELLRRNSVIGQAALAGKTNMAIKEEDEPDSSHGSNDTKV